MRKKLVKKPKHGLTAPKECPLNHEPNEVTQRAIDNARKRRGLSEAATIEELFKKLVNK